MKLIDKAVYLEKERILVITDLHIGYEEGVNLGIREQYNQIIQDLKKIFEEINEKVKKVVVLGDLKHAFSKNITQEWVDIKKFFLFLKEKMEEKGEIILIKGNHDKFIETIASNYDISVKEYYIQGDNAFIHGDKKIFINENNKKIEIMKAKKIKTIFLGHLHPAILLQEDAKREIYKCFLIGKHKSKKIVILPSFFPLVEGSDISKEETNLAYDFKLKKFEVYIPDGNKVLNFGKVQRVGSLAN